MPLPDGTAVSLDGELPDRSRRSGMARRSARCRGTVLAPSRRRPDGGTASSSDQGLGRRWRRRRVPITYAAGGRGGFATAAAVPGETNGDSRGWAPAARQRRFRRHRGRPRRRWLLVGPGGGAVAPGFVRPRDSTGVIVGAGGGGGGAGHGADGGGGGGGGTDGSWAPAVPATTLPWHRRQQQQRWRGGSVANSAGLAATGRGRERGLTPTARCRLGGRRRRRWWRGLLGRRRWHVGTVDATNNAVNTGDALQQRQWRWRGCGARDAWPSGADRRGRGHDLRQRRQRGHLRRAVAS